MPTVCYILTLFLSAVTTVLPSISLAQSPLQTVGKIHFNIIVILHLQNLNGLMLIVLKILGKQQLTVEH